MANYSSTDMSVTIGLTDMDFDNANRWQVKLQQQHLL